MAMSPYVLDAILAGPKKNYYIEDATDNAADNTKFESTTLQKYVVPANSRWILIGGVVQRDAAETLDIDIYDASDQHILHLDTDAAATDLVTFPSTKANKANHNPVSLPIILDEGEYINILFGGAQGAGAYASCIVIELRVGED